MVYVDGRPVGTHNISSRAASLGSKKFLEIGRGDRPFEGLMDDLRIYSRALSGDQVRRIATGRGDDPEASELLGWWKFDEEQGTSFADSSGKNHTAGLIADAADGTWLTYQPDPATLRQGDNGLTFQLQSGAPRELSITNVELHVTYR